MFWAQLILLWLLVTSLIAGAARHGTPKSGRHSFAVDLISFAIMLTLIFLAGGFSTIFR